MENAKFFGKYITPAQLEEIFGISRAYQYKLRMRKNYTDESKQKRPPIPFLKNDMVVKTFYVAHNADRIIIVGNKEIAQDYKEYLLKNDCKNIAIHPVDSIGGSKKRVNILFFGMKGENDESFIKNFTNLFNF